MKIHLDLWLCVFHHQSILSSTYAVDVTHEHDREKGDQTWRLDEQTFRS